MNTVLNLGSAILLGASSPVTAGDLEQYQWKNRLVLVFADSQTDEKLRKQIDFLAAGQAELSERDIVIIQNTEPDDTSDMRKRFNPTGFLFVLIGKDGSAKLKSTTPIEISDLTGLIDTMPMRLQEMGDQNQN
ncbi:MAG: DUF4174 domain-containing protein [Pseudomonadota bacterium]